MLFPLTRGRGVETPQRGVECFPRESVQFSKKYPDCETVEQDSTSAQSCIMYIQAAFNMHALNVITANLAISLNYNSLCLVEHLSVDIKCP